jgi:HTH-type transcriptional regulator/antitoxin HigA
VTIKPIHSDDELRAAFRRLETVFQAETGTSEADVMEILVPLIEAYENKHTPIGPADPSHQIPHGTGSPRATWRPISAPAAGCPKC